MKVLWFANTPCGALTKLTGKPSLGGGWLSALSEQLKKIEEIELHIVFYWGAKISSFEYEGIIYHPVLRDGDSSRFGRYYHRVITQFSDSCDRKEVKRLLEVVRDVNPDVIHIHGSEENFGLIAEHLPDKKIFLSIQGILSPIIHKYFSGIPEVEWRRFDGISMSLILDGISGTIRRNKRRVKREQAIYSYINNFIGRTEWDKAASLALNPNRCYYCCNEVLRPEFYNHKWQPRTKIDILKITTTISSGLTKGLETLYYTANILSSSKFMFEWNVIGLDDNNRYVKLTNFYTNLNPKNIHINFLGRKSASEIVALLDKSDLYVQVSHIENSPNTVCEAMALGMPIIASFAGGTSSILKDQEDGYLVQSGEPYSLAGYIIETKNNYEKAISLGMNARAHALKRHNPNDVLKGIIDIYSHC